LMSDGRNISLVILLVHWMIQILFLQDTGYRMFAINLFDFMINVLHLFILLEDKVRPVNQRLILHLSILDVRLFY